MPRGRNKELLSRRDEKLLRRYYELTEVQNLRFDRALTLLSKDEFFISEARIMAIIRKNCNRLGDIDVNPVPKVSRNLQHGNWRCSKAMKRASYSVTVTSYLISYTLIPPGRL